MEQHRPRWLTVQLSGFVFAPWCEHGAFIAAEAGQGGAGWGGGDDYFCSLHSRMARRSFLLLADQRIFHRGKRVKLLRPSARVCGGQLRELRTNLLIKCNWQQNQKDGICEMKSVPIRF